MYINEVIGGVEYEAAPGLNVGVHYVHRDIPRVLEDVQPYPIVAFDLGVPGTQTVNYLLTNPGPNTPVLGDLGASFEAPIHTLQRRRGDRRQAIREPVGAAGVVSVLAAARDLRGILPRRQRAVGSGHHVAVRLSNQRSQLHGDRRPAVRLQRRRAIPRRARPGAAPARSPAPGQGLRELLVRHGPEPRPWLPGDLREAVDALWRPIRSTPARAKFP